MKDYSAKKVYIVQGSHGVIMAVWGSKEAAENQRDSLNEATGGQYRVVHEVIRVESEAEKQARKRKKAGK